MALFDIENGSFTGEPGKVHVLSGSLTKRYKTVRNVSGAGDAATGSLFETGRPVWTVNARGVYESSTGTYPLAVFSSKLTGDFTFTTSRIVVVKTQEIRDTTGASDAFAASSYTAGRPTYRYSGFGWADTADAQIGNDVLGTNDISTFQLVIESSTPVVLSGAIVLTSYNAGLPFTQGGPVPIRWQGFSNDAAPTNVNTPWEQTSYAANLSVAGKTFAGTVIPSSIRCDVDYENAVPTVVDVAGNFSRGITIT